MATVYMRRLNTRGRKRRMDEPFAEKHGLRVYRSYDGDRPIYDIEDNAGNSATGAFAMSEGMLYDENDRYVPLSDRRMKWLESLDL